MAVLDDRAVDLEAENAELRRRLDEALAQQQAAAEVLQVINASPGDLAPVFQAILEKAHALCGADHGALFAYEGDQFRPVATHGVPEPFAEVIRPGFRLHPENPLMALIRGESLVHVADLVEIAARTAPDNAMPRLAVELGGMRTLLAVPLRKDGVLLGFIGSYRKIERRYARSPTRRSRCCRISRRRR